MLETNSNEIEARLIELETRVAFQDDLLATLNRSTIELIDELARLQAMCKEMRTSLDSVRVAQSHDPNDEPPPPHY